LDWAIEKKLRLLLIGKIYHHNHFEIMKKLLPLLCILCFCSINAFSQSFKIFGKVIDSTNKSPIIGSTIRVLDLNRGAYSRENGDFSLRLEQGNYKLMVSYTGYESYTFNINLDKDLEVVISLNPTNQTERSFLARELVVSANKKAQAVQEVPISMSVIDSKVILTRNATRLDEMINFTPGVEVNKDNVSIRGSSGFSFGVGSRVSLLLDGNSMLSGDTGEMKFDALPLMLTERIEIVKGAGSALYGSSAIGGVINVITRDATEEMFLKATSYAGLYTQPTFESWRFSENMQNRAGFETAFAQKIGDFSVLASMAIHNDESYRKYDESRRINFFNKIKYDINERDNISFYSNFASDYNDVWINWHSLDSATYPPSGTDLENKNLSNKFNSGLEYNSFLNDNLILKVRSNIFATKFENSYNIDHPDYQGSTAYALNSEVQSTYNFEGTRNSLTGGFNVIYNNSSSPMYSGDNSQSIFAGYLQQEYWMNEAVVLTIGGRYDVEQTGDAQTNSAFSPKLGAAITLDNKINLRMSAGGGFRVPAIAERYATIAFGGFRVLPNLELKPERAFSYEVGGNYELNIGESVFQFDLALFRNEMQDLIEPSFSTGSAGVIQFLNINEALINGLEFSIRSLPVKFLGMETSVVYSDPRDLTANTRLKYRSNLLFYNRMFVFLGDLELQLDYQHKSRWSAIDERLGLPDANGNPGIRNHDARVPVNLVDLRLIYKNHKIGGVNLTHTLNMFNIFNYYYLQMVGNLGMTRQLSYQISAEF